MDNNELKQMLVNGGECMQCGRYSDDLLIDLNGHGDEILVCRACHDEEHGRRMLVAEQSADNAEGE